MTYQKALLWSGFWILSALTFAGGIGYYSGLPAASTFLTAYIVEKMLSFDNLFMFYIIFEYFRLSRNDQRRALNWGVIGAVLLRGAFIYSSCFFVSQFHWLIYGFAAFLVYSAFAMLGEKEEDKLDVGLIKRIKERFPHLSELVIVIVVIELTDIMFALDSIPAILSITQDTFLVYSSNLFAILGLRSLYFVLLELINRFHYLKHSVSLILAFIGTKILISHWIAISTYQSLMVILGVIMTGILLSTLTGDKK